MVLIRPFYLTSNSICTHLYLFVQELPRVFFYVSFIEVGGQAHQAHFRQAKVSQLDVSYWGDQEAENRIKAEPLELCFKTGM